MQFSLTLLRRWAVPAVLVALFAAAIALWPGPRGGLSGSGGIWTCSMHPQIRMDHFDRCPICGMDLIPVKSSLSAVGPSNPSADRLQLSPQAVLSARASTEKVAYRALFRDIRTVGKIDFDETRMAQIASRVAGRVEQVFADFPGTMVKKGDHLVGIYSPDLVSTQEEFLVASRREQESKGIVSGVASLAASARRRLLLWGISDEQINQILTSGKAQTLLTVYAPLGGTVVEKMVRAGQYVKEGETLYTIADLDHVWLLVEVYESDLAWVRFGQSVQVTLEADPASITGQIGFIEPVLNEQTRTVRVRVILKNEERKLRPGMFAQALIRVPIMPDGTPAPTGLEGKFACPMHPYVVQDAAATCRVCEMALEKIPGNPLDLKEPPSVLAVPADAVLTTGRRQLVYVDRGQGVYQLVEPHLGSRAGDYYPVLGGLKEGDPVVARGGFLLDSQFQISGKPSLLYPQGMSGNEQAGPSDVASTRAPNAEFDAADSAKVQMNLGKLSASDRQLAVRQVHCPVTGLRLGAMGVPMKLDVDGQAVFVCCAGCTSLVRQDPRGILDKLSLPKSTAETSK